MTKKKRLGRGLEALLSSVGDPVPQHAPEPPAASSAPAEAPTAPTAPANRSGGDSAEPKIIPMHVSGGPLPGGSRQPSSAPNPSPRTPSPNPPPSNGMVPGSGESLLRLSVEEIDDNPFQPRRDFTEPEIVSLAESLKEHNMLQPVLVRRVGSRFQLISGERRLRAAIRAGWTTIPAQIREADDRLVAELAIVENLQRKDLNAIEKALSFRRYLDEHGSSQEELAGRLKIDRSTIANLIRLLELPDIVQQSVRTSVISAGHARSLLPLGEEHLQIEYCNRVQAEGWSVRETERQVSEYVRGADDPLGTDPKARKAKTRTPSHQLTSLEQEFRMALGTKVEIKKSSRGKGRITVHFNSVDEFERIRQLLCESSLGSSSRAAS